MSLDPRQHTTAVLGLLTGKGVAAYRQNEVPGTTGGPAGTLPNLFAIVHVERRFIGYTRSSGENDITGWRATIVHAGRTVTEAQWVAMRVSEALNEAVLMIGGEPYGPVQFELEQTPESDSGRYSGRTQWTY